MATAKVGDIHLPRLLPSGDVQVDQSQPAFPPDFLVPELKHPDELQEAFSLSTPFFDVSTLSFVVPSPQLGHPDELSINEFEY